MIRTMAGLVSALALTAANSPTTFRAASLPAGSEVSMNIPQDGAARRVRPAFDKFRKCPFDEQLAVGEHRAAEAAEERQRDRAVRQVAHRGLEQAAVGEVQLQGVALAVLLIAGRLDVVLTDEAAAPDSPEAPDAAVTQPA